MLLEFREIDSEFIKNLKKHIEILFKEFIKLSKNNSSWETSKLKTKEFFKDDLFELEENENRTTKINYNDFVEFLIGANPLTVDEGIKRLLNGLWLSFEDRDIRTFIDSVDGNKIFIVRMESKFRIDDWINDQNYSTKEKEIIQSFLTDLDREFSVDEVFEQETRYLELFSTKIN